MSAAVALVADQQGRLLDALVSTVRVEFSAEVVHVDPDDPVFGRGRCQAAGCERTAWTRRVCVAHYNRWRYRGQPDIVEYCATTGPIVGRAGSHFVDAFDLSGLAPQPRLEVAYILQCCHDDRRVRVPPSIIRHLVGLLAETTWARCWSGPSITG